MKALLLKLRYKLTPAYFYYNFIYIYMYGFYFTGI